MTQTVHVGMNNMPETITVNFKFLHNLMDFSGRNKQKCSYCTCRARRLFSGVFHFMKPVLQTAKFLRELNELCYKFLYENMPKRYHI